MELKREYDFICSLGASCMAAHNLLYKGMRHYSLPFDWCYIKTSQPIEYLCEGFQNNFKDFLLKENLVQLTGDEYNPSHTDKAQFKDILTGYYFVNHFSKNNDFETEYKIVYNKMQRRIKRMMDKIESGTNILFILSASFHFNPDSIEKLSKTLSELYPNKNIDFYVMSFACEKNEKYNINDNIFIRNYIRSINSYDFKYTNFEWEFLDNITLKPDKKSKINKIIEIKKLRKKGLGIYILQAISTIFRMRFYIFGLRLDICIGRIHE